MVEMENKSIELTRQHVKKFKIGAIVVFNIVLPLVDVFTDLHLIIKLYSVEQRNFASLLLGEKESEIESYMRISLSVPFLFNYIASFMTWYRLEKNWNSWTVLAPLFNVHSIYGI